jgi:hypothetical protein
MTARAGIWIIVDRCLFVNEVAVHDHRSSL